MKIAALITVFTAVSFCYGGEILFEETFENFPEGASLKDGVGDNSWNVNSDTREISDAQVSITRGVGANGSQVAVTTPMNADGGQSGTIMNISTSFADTDTEKPVRLSFDVYPEHGSGQVMLRASDGDPSQGLVRLHFRSSPNMQICVFTKSEDGELQVFPLGGFRFGQWYHVQITLHLAKEQYDIEVFELENEDSIVSVQGLDFNDLVPTFGNVLVGAIFGEKSRYSWDNIKVETGDFGAQ